MTTKTKDVLPWWQTFAAAGPGVLLAVASIGPQDLVTNSAAGASYGYQLLWVLIPVGFARFFFLDATARYVLATGEPILDGYRRMGQWSQWVILGAILIKRYAAGLYQVILLGMTMHWLLPLPFEGSENVWSVVCWVSAYSIMIFGKYGLVEKACKPLAIGLTMCLAGAAWLSRPDLGGALRGLTLPSLPSGDDNNLYLVLMAVVGAAAGSLSNIKYAAYIHEKGWRDPSRLRIQRWDLILGIVGLVVMSMFIQVAGAAVLHGLETDVSSPEDLLLVFGERLGTLGRVLISAGLWGAIFTTVLSANTGYAILVVDLVRGVRGEETKQQAGEHPAYVWFLLWFGLAPMHALLTDWSPVLLVLIGASLELVLFPFIAIVILMLTSDRTRMGPLVNSTALKFGLGFVILASLVLTGKNALRLFAA